MGKIKTNKEFERVAILIEEVRNRAFQKVNEELVYDTKERMYLIEDAFGRQ